MLERDICLNCALDDCDDTDPRCPLKVMSREGKRRYREENRDKWNAYMREYSRKRREQRRESAIRENQSDL